MVAKRTSEAAAFNGAINNDSGFYIDMQKPYFVDVDIVGTAKILFHRWSGSAVAEKSKAAKGSKAKKTDNIESYVYRNRDEEICVPGEYLRRALVMQAKSEQDPRSPRKSAMALFNAGLIVNTELCGLGTKDWDFLDERRVIINGSAITRTRPGFHEGWGVSCQFQIITPQYISIDLFSRVLADAGVFVGIGDYRPTFGRFRVSALKQVELK